jgi:hypothetical protein
MICKISSYSSIANCLQFTTNSVMLHYKSFQELPACAKIERIDSEKSSLSRSHHKRIDLILQSYEAFALLLHGLFRSSGLFRDSGRSGRTLAVHDRKSRIHRFG